MTYVWRMLSTVGTTMDANGLSVLHTNSGASRVHGSHVSVCAQVVMAVMTARHGEAGLHCSWCLQVPITLT
jgi:uncharacterized membrane protein YeiH